MADEVPPPGEATTENPKKGKGKDKKNKKVFDPLSDDEVKFKKIDFDNALTPEEKAAQKAEKLAAKKGPKKGGKKKTPTPEAVEEPVNVPPVEVEDPKKKEKFGKTLTEAAPPPPPPKKIKIEDKQEENEKPVKGKAEKSKKEKKNEGDEEAKPKKEKKSGKGKPEKKQDGETRTAKSKKTDSQVEMQPTGGIATEDQVKSPEAGEPASPKDGKGKGGKGKKGKKGKKTANRTSFSEFLEYRASQQIEVDEWTWESYSVSEDVLVEPEVIEKKKKGKGKKEDGGEKPKKEKKDKKGKKGEKEDKPPEEPPPAAELDIFAEINRLKALAEAQAMGIVVEEVIEAPPKKKKAKKEKPKESEAEPKEKKPKGPKLTKQQKRELAAEMAKIAAKEAEIAAKKAEEEERLRLIEERKANIAKQKRETKEQQLRIEQLNSSSFAMNNVKERCVEKRMKENAEREWNQYLKCDGLPDPNVCGELNTYLHLWEKAMETITMDETADRTNEVLYLIGILNNLIDDPECVDAEVVNNWKWVKNMFCEYQQKTLDATTYRLLRDIENNFNRLDLFLADYRRKEKHFTISFWLLIKMPPSLPNPKQPEEPRVHLDFPEIIMNVLFPTNINCKFMAIRAMYLNYDHLSIETATFNNPPEPEHYTKNLNQVTAAEWRKKLFYKYEALRKEQRQIPITELPKEKRLKKIDLNNAEAHIPAVPYEKLEPTASEFVISEEDQFFINLREGMVIEVAEHVINLRRFMILGGVYFLNLYYQPPQPKDMVSFVMTITRLEVPPHLCKVPFHKTIEALPMKLTGEDEGEGEEEGEATQEEMDEFRKEELNQLILIKFRIPTHVLLFQPPILCQWYRVTKVWSTVDIHEFEYDDETKTITFKSGKFGSFAIATPRLLNFPFKYWEIKANADTTITFVLATQIITVTFNVKENLVCISELIFELDNFKTDIIAPLIGKYHRLPILIRIMREIGIEIFPPYDAFCYIEGTCEKYLIVEKYLYTIMGYLSIQYNFLWSRWNFSAGRRNMILLMREYKPGKSKQFYSDLFHLMRAITSMPVKLKIQNANPSTAVTLSELLLATRILSLC